MKDLITTREAAEELGVTPRRVLALIYDDRLPATKVGRDWLINPTHLDNVRHRPAGYPRGRPRKSQLDTNEADFSGMNLDENST